MPTFGSLFSGIGGLDLGLERAGWQCKWQVEINDYRRRVLERHWPDVARFRDVRECHGGTACPLAFTDSLRLEEHRMLDASVSVGSSDAASKEEGSCPWCLPPVILICAGFPYQPFSVAGKRKGEGDERNLWPETIRIIREVRPRLVLLENVPGLLCGRRGRPSYFGTVLADLAESGYDVEWDSIPASAFGAPHLRYRVYIVAHATALRLERPELFWQRFTKHGRIMYDGWWTVEPDVGRVAHGVPSRVDRLAALGDAVVPQVAEWLGTRLLEAL